MMLERIKCFVFIVVICFSGNNLFAQKKNKISSTDTIYYSTYKADGIMPFYYGGKVGLIDTAGKIILPPTYERIYEKQGGVRIYRQGGKYGFLNSTGEIICPASLDFIYIFRNYQTVTAVKKNEKWGLINNRGQMITGFIYDDVPFNAFRIDRGITFIKVKWNNKYGFVDTTGRQIGDWYEDVNYWFAHGFCSVKKDGKWGIINASGKAVIDFIYQKASNYDDNYLARVKLKNKYGFIDTTGKVIIEIKYSDCLWFGEGLCPVKTKGKWGYIDTGGNVILPFIYKDVNSFSQGLAAVKIKSKYGYIDKKGNVIIAFQFRNAYNFCETCLYASVKPHFYTRFWKTIDKEGKYH
jgi:hypothetical protein